jgi:ribosomal protein S18 acetylase RimI-like enzyme
MKPAIHNLEEYSLNAWAAPHYWLLDGWILRFAGGHTRRSNSVLPLYPPNPRGRDTSPPSDVEAKIDHCEAIYRGLGQAAMFKITPLSVPEDLDRRLAARGYRREADTLVQTRHLSDLETLEPERALASNAAEHRLEVLDALSDEWLQRCGGWNKMTPHQLHWQRQILVSIVPRVLFATLYCEQRAVASGFAVIQDHYAGLFDIVTAPEARNQGQGRRLVTGLLEACAGLGAQWAYLQVMTDNTPALTLYRKMGFEDVYEYWYRVEESPSAE